MSLYNGYSSYRSPNKCLIFWDYENMPIPAQYKLENVIDVLHKNIRSAINIDNIPIEITIYMGYSFVIGGGLNKEFGKGYETLGIKINIVGSMKPEAVDKRIICDMMYALFECEQYKQSKIMGLISGDIDFGYLLSKLHKNGGIYKLLLILLGPNTINHYFKYTPNVDHIIHIKHKIHFDNTPRIKSEQNKQNKEKKSKKKIKENKEKIKEKFDEKYDENKSDGYNNAKDINEDRLRTLLNYLGLTKYYYIMIDDGFSDLDTLCQIKEADLNITSMKRGEIRKLLNAIDSVNKNAKRASKPKTKKKYTKKCKNGKECHQNKQGNCRCYHINKNKITCYNTPTNCDGFKNGMCKYNHSYGVSIELVTKFKNNLNSYDNNDNNDSNHDNDNTQDNDNNEDNDNNDNNDNNTVMKVDDKEASIKSYAIGKNYEINNIEKKSRVKVENETENKIDKMNANNNGNNINEIEIQNAYESTNDEIDIDCSFMNKDDKDQSKTVLNVIENSTIKDNTEDEIDYIDDIANDIQNDPNVNTDVLVNNHIYNQSDNNLIDNLIKDLDNINEDDTDKDHNNSVIDIH